MGVQSIVPTTLNISPQTSGEANLKHGEVVQGVIQEVKADGTVSVLVKGRVIEATTDLQLTAGDKLSLLVDGSKSDKIFLRIAGNEVMQEIAKNNIGKTLADLGVAVKPESVSLGQTLLQYRLPLTVENMAVMDKIIRALGEMSPRNLNAAAFALSKGISDPAQVKSLLQFFQTGEVRQSVGVLLQIAQNLRQAAAPLAAQTAAAAGNSPEANTPPGVSGSNMTPPGTAASAAANPAATVPNPNPVPASSAPPPGINPPAAEALPTANSFETAKPPAASAPSGTTPPAAEPALPGDAAVRAAASDQPPSVFRPNSIPAPGGSFTPISRETAANLVMQFTDLLEAAVKDISLELEKPANEIKADLQQKLQFEGGITKDLQLAKAIAEHPQLTSHFPALKAALPHLNALEQDWTAQRLNNGLPQNNPLQPDPIYFALPVRVDDSYYMCQLKIQKDGASAASAANSDECKVAVALSTAHMGTVVFHVGWKRDTYLNLQGVVTNEPVRKYLDQNMPLLLQELKAAGYETQYLGIKVSSAIPEIKPEISAAKPAFTPIGIDIRI